MQYPSPAVHPVSRFGLVVLSGTGMLFEAAGVTVVCPSASVGGTFPCSCMSVRVVSAVVVVVVALSDVVRVLRLWNCESKWDQDDEEPDFRNCFDRLVGRWSCLEERSCVG